MRPRSLDQEDMNVLHFIEDYSEKHGISPTFREIGLGCYMAHTTARRHVRKLVSFGLLLRQRHIGRSIVLVNPRLTTLRTTLPLKEHQDGLDKFPIRVPIIGTIIA